MICVHGCRPDVCPSCGRAYYEKVGPMLDEVFRSPGPESPAPTIAARLEEAVGLLRELHANMNHRVNCVCRTGKLLAAIDAEKAREGT